MTRPDEDSIATLLMRSIGMDRYTAEAACRNVLNVIERRVFTDMRELPEDYPDLIRELLREPAELPAAPKPTPPGIHPGTWTISGGTVMWGGGAPMPTVPAPPPVTVVATGAPKTGKLAMGGVRAKRTVYDEFYKLRDAAEESRKLMDDLKKELARYSAADAHLTHEILERTDPTKRPPADPAKRKPKRAPKTLKK